MQTEIATWGTLLAAIVTAVATFFLWRVTKILAIETSRMADATGQPQVVATLTPNAWAQNYIDINVANTGNATAFGIQVVFDPALQPRRPDDEKEIPFKTVSVLRVRTH